MRRLLLCLFVLFAAACSEDKSQFTGSCEKNEQCGVGGFCKKARGQASGICACRSDEACNEGEICNSQGVCQKRSACRSNTECEMSKFCDLATGACIDRTDCGTDLHCLPGTVCDHQGQRCVDGCLDDADCKLYSVCDRTGLTSTTALGRCLMGRCGDKTFCAYGENCINGLCVRDPNPNYCRDCDPSTDDCGDPQNYCLINSAYDGNPARGGPNFCGIACSSPQDPNACPNGYQCGSVILLTQDQCTTSPECGGGGRVCVLGEGDVRGFCTCANDADCAIDRAPPICLSTCGGINGASLCNTNADCIALPCQPSFCVAPANQACSTDAQCQPSDICTPIYGQNVCLTNGMLCNRNEDCLCTEGRCLGSGRPCTSGAECSLSCQNGGCFLGNSCAPIQGLLCPDLRR